MRCLITGGSGFIGHALAGYLVANGHSAWCASRRGTAPDGGTGLMGDITDPKAVAGWLDVSAPDVVVHLSAQSLPGVSWKAPAETFACNVNGTLHLLAAIKERAPKARLVMVSSSSVYAPPAQEKAIVETDPLRGSSPYAWSKIAAEQAALLYGKHFGLDVVLIRPFFIIGPGKTGDVSSDFARRIVSVERGQSNAVTVGSLDITRDFLDIDDAVGGIRCIIEKGVSGEAYNLSSGVPATIRALLDVLKKQATVDIKEVVNPDLVRPIDEPHKVGNATKLQSLGWTPRLAFEESLRRILMYWRDQA